MKRRGFLSALGAAVGAFALDPERALWVPGAKLISIPRPLPLRVHYRQNVRLHPYDGQLVGDSFMLLNEREGAAYFVERCGFSAARGLPPDVRAALAHSAGVDPDRLVLA